MNKNAREKNNSVNEQITESKKIKWDEMPSGAIGWILWALPQNLWKGAILFGAMISLCIVGMTYWYLFQKESYALQKATLEIDSIRKQYFTELWKRSERPEWKVVLLTYSKPEEIPGEYWRKFIEHENADVQVAAAIHPYIPSLWLDQCLKSNNIRVAVGAIMNRTNKLEIFKLLKRRGEDQIRWILAMNQHTPPDILAKLSEDPEVKDKVASNPSTPPDILAKLSEDPEVKRDVASNPSTPPDILAKLSEDPEVKDDVASNPRTPPDILAKLSEDPEVKRDVASNPSTSPDILAKLAEDPACKMQLIQQPNTPPEILAMLFENQGIKELLLVQYSLHRRLFGGWGESAVFSISTNMPVNAMDKLAEDSRFAKLLAQNPSTPPDILAKLSEDPEVKRDVASNPSTPPDILAKLSEDPEVKRDVASNPSTPPDILTKFAEDPDRFIRFEVAKNDKTPEISLKRMEYDIKEIRGALAKNSSTPLETLKKLIIDRNPEIQSMALYSALNKL